MIISVISELKLLQIRRYNIHVHVHVHRILCTGIILQGVNLVQELISDYGLNVVQAYMNHIQVCQFCEGNCLQSNVKLLQQNAELGVREMLMEIGSKTKVIINETNQCSVTS